MQVVVLVAELQDGGLELGTLGHAHAQGEVAGGDVADDDLQGHDLDLLYKGVAVVDLLHIMGGDALFLQLLHQGIGQLVVHDALVADGALLLAVTGGGIVLVVDHYDLGVAGSENLLGLAFVHLLFNFVIHRKTLLLLWVIIISSGYFHCTLFLDNVQENCWGFDTFLCLTARRPRQRWRRPFWR